MGDPMAPSFSEGNSEGGGSARWVASREAKRAGITSPQLLEMSRPGALGTKEKTLMTHLLYSFAASRRSRSACLSLNTKLWTAKARRSAD